MQKKGWKKRIAYLLYLVLFTVLALEVILRIYNPFPPTFTGKKFRLPANTSYHIRNDNNPRLDKMILHKRNSIGFRGPQPPADINAYLSIIAVGGSTTACTYLGEGQTWCDQLQQQLQLHYAPLWINNAGVDGHTTYGHLNLLRYYLPQLSFKPKLLLFLVGANDVNLRQYDSGYTKPTTIKSWLLEHSETAGLLHFLKWTLAPNTAVMKPMAFNFTNSRKVTLDSLYIDSVLRLQEPLVAAFEKRLTAIAALCRQYQVQPVFITQPSVFGDGTTTGGNPAIDTYLLHEIAWERLPENGQLYWRKLQRYNQQTKMVAARENVFCIDLATLMPKDTTLFYDVFHYTPRGAVKVSQLIASGLDTFCRAHYPGWYHP